METVGRAELTATMWHGIMPVSPAANRRSQAGRAIRGRFSGIEKHTLPQFQTEQCPQAMSVIGFALDVFVEQALHDGWLEVTARECARIEQHVAQERL